MNFLGDGNDSWDSTPTQEAFIQNYFKPSNAIVTKRSRKRKKHPLSSVAVSTSLMSNSLENKTSNEIPKQNNLSKKSKLTPVYGLEKVSAKCNNEETMADNDVTANFINKNSKSRSPEKKIFSQKSSKNSKEVSDCMKYNNDIIVIDESSKQNFQNSNSPSKKINLKKSSNPNTNKTSQNKLSDAEVNFQLKNTKITSISKKSYLNDDSDNFKNKVIQNKLQNLKKIKSKANKALQKPSTADSNVKRKSLKVAKKISNPKESGLNAYESDDSEDEVIQNEQQNLKKRKSKTSKLTKSDESENSESEVLQNRQQNLNKIKSKTSKQSQTNESDDSEDEVIQIERQNLKKRKSKPSKPTKSDESDDSESKVLKNKQQNIKKKKSKTSKPAQTDELDDPEDEVSEKEMKKLKKKTSKTGKASSSNENCSNVDDSEDDEVIRNELQNSRMFLKIQKLIKVAPHLNPNFHKDSATEENNSSYEEISNEDSSSESDGEHSSDDEYASDSEKEEALKSNVKDSSEVHSDDSSNNDEDDSTESEEQDMQPQESHQATSKQEIPTQDLERSSYIQKTKNVNKPTSVLEKARAKLASAKFRFLNEKLYTESGSEAFRYFQENKEEFEDYHLGYGQQVSKWPLNPVDEILADLQKMNKTAVIADLGCGDAKIARVLTSRTVHSFDLVAMHKCVTPCDISKVPLRDCSVDVAVFCLSLMGVNLIDYLREAYRILKIGGILKIAEVESRIEDLELFIKNLGTLGFVLERKNTKNKLFVFLDLKKVKKGKAVKATTITLRPCMYKKR